MKEVQKQLIEKYQISATHYANIKKWGDTRCHFKIQVFNKEFDYFDSVDNYKKDIRKLDLQGLLFGFYCIISDAISYAEYNDNINDFAFCEDTFYKLESTKKFEYNLKLETLYKIMEELRSAGIE